MIVRLFLSAVGKNDVEELIRLFHEDVKPAFEAHPACLGIDLVTALAPGVGGLIEGGAITKWTSVAEMEKALESPELTASQDRIRELLRREPIRKVFQVID